MACGKYNIKDSCTDRAYATCNFYQTELPLWSELENQDCVTIEETTEELYNEVSDIKDQLDTESLGQKCLEYPTNTEGDVTQLEVNETFETEICNLKSILDISATPNGVFCQNLDYGDLINPQDCDGKPTTWCEFAQFILNKLKELQ